MTTVLSKVLSDDPESKVTTYLSISDHFLYELSWLTRIGYDSKIKECKMIHAGNNTIH